MNPWNIMMTAPRGKETGVRARIEERVWGVGGCGVGWGCGGRLYAIY